MRNSLLHSVHGYVVPCLAYFHLLSTNGLRSTWNYHVVCVHAALRWTQVYMELSCGMRACCPHTASALRSARSAHDSGLSVKSGISRLFQAALEYVQCLIWSTLLVIIKTTVHLHPGLHGLSGWI